MAMQGMIRLCRGWVLVAAAALLALADAQADAQAGPAAVDAQAPAVAGNATAAPIMTPAPVAVAPVGDTAVAKAAQLVQQDAVAAVQRKRPELVVAELLSFYRENAPDLLAEWERRCAQQPDSAESYLALLAEHYASIVKMKDEDPDEYERLLWQQRQESKVRSVSRAIQNLSRPGEDGSLGAEAARLMRLQEEKMRLRQLLEEGFDNAQQRQMVEINRLENEVRDLRRLVSERAANRQLILEQRFMVLTGEEWPQLPAEEREAGRMSAPADRPLQ
jgi:hypothetical protein